MLFHSSGVQEVEVDIIDDEILETIESVVITISNPRPDIVEFNDSSITIFIVDNDIRKLKKRMMVLVYQRTLVHLFIIMQFSTVYPILILLCYSDDCL